MGSWSETRRDIREKKYAFVDDEAVNAPAKGKKPSPKKAKHKHKYKPLLIDSYSKHLGHWVRNYISYCPICGKLGDHIDDPHAEKLFPGVHAGTLGFFSFNLSSEGDFEPYKKWAEENYPLVVWKDFDYFKDKVIPLGMIEEDSR